MLKFTSSLGLLATSKPIWLCKPLLVHMHFTTEETERSEMPVCCWLAGQTPVSKANLTLEMVGIAPTHTAPLCLLSCPLGRALL